MAESQTYDGLDQERNGSLHDGIMHDGIMKNMSSVGGSISDSYDKIKNTVQSAAIAGVVPGENVEGSTTKAIEFYTSKAPSGVYLSAAMGAAACSALLHLNGRKRDALFVGMWVPSILVMGLYNKLVKLGGSESY